MVRVNVRTPPCAEQPAPALPPLAAQRATTQFQVQGDGGQQHSKQTGLIRCTLVIIVRRSPVIDMSEHSWLRGLLCCPKSPLPLLTPGLVCSSAAPVSDFCWICANVWHHAVVLLMQHGSGPYFVKQVKRGQGQKCKKKTGKPGKKCVFFEQVQGTPVVIMLSGDVSGPLVTLCSLDTLQRCRRPAAAALQPDCRSILPLGGHMGAELGGHQIVRHPPQQRG